MLWLLSVWGWMFFQLLRLTDHLITVGAEG